MEFTWDIAFGTGLLIGIYIGIGIYKIVLIYVDKKKQKKQQKKISEEMIFQRKCLP